MARQSAAGATMVAVVLALIAAVAVNAEESPASSPSPSAVTGAGISLPVSGGIVAFSLLFSLISLFRH